MEQAKGNAKLLNPKRGARAEAERRLGISPQLGQARWNAMQPDFVLLVMEIDAEMRQEERRKAALIAKHFQMIAGQ